MVEEVKEKISSIKYEDIIKGKDGENITRTWIVSPDGEHGLGTASTLKTFYDLFQIWKEQKFSSQFIYFGSIHKLLKKRGSLVIPVVSNYLVTTGNVYILPSPGKFFEISV